MILHTLARSLDMYMFGKVPLTSHFKLYIGMSLSVREYVRALSETHTSKTP